jgi:hypothetical protein
VILDQAFIPDDFNPEDTPFMTSPTMSEAVLGTMLPDMEGKVYSANLHESIYLKHILHILCEFLYLACLHFHLIFLMPSSVSLNK